MTIDRQSICDNLDLWTSVLLTKSTAGRGSNGRVEAYGIKKLRGLILELAVRGKLVSQEPTDEPASVLLERIVKEKTQLAKEGKCKNTKSFPELGESEFPFPVPVGWEWTMLGNIGQANTGYAFKSTEYTESGTFVLRVTNINTDGTINQDDKKYIDFKEAESTYEKFKLQKDDVLLVMVGGSLGKLGIVTDDCLPAVLNQNMWKLDRFGGIALDFFLMGLKYINNNQLKVTSSTHGHLAQGEYMDKLFPLPPLAEQHRIVAKVDELMALCDQLEQQQTNSIEGHQTLVETLLGMLTNVESREEFTEAWTRIANHFDTLFTTEQSIDQLKQAILQLAVMGKLVLQDSNDEPASVLLEMIAKGKRQLIKAGRQRKEKPLPRLADEMLFQLPKGWEWVALGTIAIFENGDRSSRYPNSDDLQDSGVPFFGAPDIVGGVLRFDNGLRFISEDKFNELSNGKLIHKDIVMLLRGTVGKMATFFESDEFKTGFINAQMLIIRLTNKELCDFFGLYSSSMFFYSQVEAKITGSAVRQMPASVVADFAVPLPPFAEQHRIVAKVNELMTLCDTLKARLAAAQTTQIHLADTIVEQAVA